MNLLIKRVDGGLGLALHDEAGNILPDQTSLVINSSPNAIATATVVFAIGDGVVLAGDERDATSSLSGTGRIPR
jgi:hypothetical protein